MGVDEKEHKVKTQTFLYMLAGTTGTIDRGVVDFENKPLKTWAEFVGEVERTLTCSSEEYPVTDVDRSVRALSDSDTGKNGAAQVTVPHGTVLSPELSKFLARSGVRVVGLS